jgi:hypothetical protein
VVLPDVDTSAPDAGRLIVDAVKHNAPWVFPGADRHRAPVEREVEELLAAFPELPPPGTA